MDSEFITAGAFPAFMSEVPIKLIVVGGPKTGKTAIVHRFKKKKFQEEYQPTIGFNVNTFQLTKTIQRHNLDICLQIWDVSHVELKGLHLATIFEDVSGVMVVVDPTADSKSLQVLDDWLDVIETYCGGLSNTPVTIVLSKHDLCQTNTTQSTSLIASSLSLTSQSSFVKFFGGIDASQEASETSKRNPKGQIAQSLQELSPKDLQSVMNSYCDQCGIREWKQCSSKTGKNVKDALYSLVNMSLQPVLEARNRKNHEVESKTKPKIPQKALFLQPLQNVPFFDGAPVE